MSHHCLWHRLWKLERGPSLLLPPAITLEVRRALWPQAFWKSLRKFLVRGVFLCLILALPLFVRVFIYIYILWFDLFFIVTSLEHS